MNFNRTLLKQKAASSYHWLSTHRNWSIFFAAILVVIGYKTFSGSAPAQTRYILGEVTRGTLTTTLTGVGQISSSDQVDIKPKVSAEIRSVDVVAGQEVKAGQALAHLDTRDALQAYQNASIALQNAQITLQKLQQNQTVDATTAQENLSQAYEDGLNSVTSVFLQLPTILDTTRAVLYDDTLKGACSPNACQYGNVVSTDSANSFKMLLKQTEDDYAAAKSAYDPVFDAYRLLRRDASQDQIQKMLDDTARVVDFVAQALKSERNLLDTLVSDLTATAAKKGVSAIISLQITNYQSQISSAIGSTNSFATSLASETRSIRSSQQMLSNAALSNPLDVASQKNTVSQRQADLQSAQISLADHVLRAPFNGVIAKMNSKRGDTVSSGTTVATVISHSQLAVVQLNEVDVAKAKLGQKTTMTFDAVSDLAMSGTIAQIDALGTTTQGVVNYNVTISLDTQDARVRPGMSTSVTILLERYTDVLIVPSTAVKSQGGSQYVEVLDSSATSVASLGGVTSSKTPTRMMVTTGVSDDTSTEILSGLTEGQEIVARTIIGTTTSTTTQARPTTNALPGGATFRALGR